MVVFDNVSLRYGSTTVLEGVDLRIDEGEFIAVLGLNGSGKTSLFRMMDGLILPDSGTVTIDGMDTKDEEKIWEIRKKVGMIFQNPESQIVGTTVEEDVAFGMENIGLPRYEMVERVERVLEFVGMGELRNTEPHRLSGGQKQLLCIASVLAMQPKYMVMDEPTSMVDPIGRQTVLSTISDLHLKGHAVIFSTHILDEIAIVDRVLYVRDGKIAFDGKPLEVIEAVKEEFGISEFLEFQSELYEKGVLDRLLDPDSLIERLMRS